MLDIRAIVAEDVVWRCTSKLLMAVRKPFVVDAASAVGFLRAAGAS